MLYNELEQGNILSDVRLRLATRAYTDIPLRSIGSVHKIRQSPVGNSKALLVPPRLQRRQPAATPRARGNCHAPSVPRPERRQRDGAWCRSGRATWEG